MRAHLPWLGQGDIFGDVPVVDVTLDPGGDVRVELPRGPAVLLTHDCAMDKPNRQGLPRVDRLQFARLRSLTSLSADQQRSLRRQADRLGPFEALYVGEVADLGECLLLLSDPYYLPAAYFELGLEGHAGHPEADPVNAMYATPGAHDARIGRLDERQLELLRSKMLAYWARVTE